MHRGRFTLLLEESTPGEVYGSLKIAKGHGGRPHTKGSRRTDRIVICTLEPRRLHVAPITGLGVASSKPFSSRRVYFVLAVGRSYTLGGKTTTIRTGIEHSKLNCNTSNAKTLVKDYYSAIALFAGYPQQDCFALIEVQL
jgi:hypothetical protein